MPKQAECHPDRPHEARGKCKPCYMLEFKAKRANETAEYHKEYREANRSKLKQKEQVARDNKPVKFRDAYFKRNYGMSLIEVESMLLSQECKCAVCSMSIDMSSKHVDHCHTTGVVRGLLCHNCNIGIGMMRDNPDIMRNAITYINASRF